jgi:hypothetical protein
MSEKPAAATDASAYQGPLSPRGVRILKALVIGMAVAIFVGFGVLITMMVKRAERLGKTDVPAATGSVNVSAAPALLARTRLALPVGDTIRAVALSGSLLTVAHGSGAAERITVLDLVTGRVVSEVEVVR